jgi:hypothetical protein
VLDLVKSMAVHQSGAAYFAQPEVWKVLEVVLLESLKDAAVVPNQMLALRVLANLFHSTNTRTVVVGRAEALLETAADAARSTNKNVRLSLITLLLKYATPSSLKSRDHILSVRRLTTQCMRLCSVRLLIAISFAVHLLGQRNADDVKLQAVSIIAEMLGSESEDEDVVYRVLVTLGTLATDDVATAGMAKDLDIPSTLRRIATEKSGSKASAASAELLQLLA